MSKKATLSFNFREDLTSLDYQKIIVEQNNTIINLLAMQQDNLIHGGLNSIVKSNYAEALKPYVLKQGSDLDLKKIEENLSVSLPGSFLTSGVLETDIKLMDTTHPTLIMHGTADETVSINSSRTFFDQLPEDLPKEMIEIEGGGHGLGGVAGVPDVNYANHRDDMMAFLANKASGCLVE